MGQLGFSEILIIAIIALLIFGPKKLPELGSGLGKAIKDFKSAISDSDQQPKDDKKDEKKIEAKAQENTEDKKEEAAKK